jgi:hypothetical protein
MEKLKEVEGAEKAIEIMEKALLVITKAYQVDGISKEERANLDKLKAKIAVAKTGLAKKRKEYFAMFNDTKLDVDTDDVEVKKIGVNTNGTKVILTPVKPNGKTIYFFFGYKLNSTQDMSMRDSELEGLEDDVIDAADRGFKVVYDKSGTSAEFEAALYDSSCHGIYWSGHGIDKGNGAIQTSDGKVMRSSDFDPNKVSGKLQFLILAACQSGTGKDAWEKLINKKAADAEFQGWVDDTTTDETNDFTDEAMIGDSWYSHNGTDPDKELDDYIDKAEKAK